MAAGATAHTPGVRRGLWCAAIRSSTRAFRSPGGAAFVIARAAASMRASHGSSRSSNIAVSNLAQPLFHGAARFGDAPLDRADRRVQHGADLLVLVIAGLREQQRIAQLRRQIADGLLDVAAQSLVAERLLRRPLAARIVDLVLL